MTKISKNQQPPKIYGTACKQKVPVLKTKTGELESAFLKGTWVLIIFVEIWNKL